MKVWRLVVLAIAMGPATGAADPRITRHEESGWCGYLLLAPSEVGSEFRRRLAGALNAWGLQVYGSELPIDLWDALRRDEYAPGDILKALRPALREMGCADALKRAESSTDANKLLIATCPPPPAPRWLEPSDVADSGLPGVALALVLEFRARKARSRTPLGEDGYDFTVSRPHMRNRPAGLVASALHDCLIGATLSPRIFRVDFRKVNPRSL